MALGPGAYLRLCIVLAAVGRHGYWSLSRQQEVLLHQVECARLKLGINPPPRPPLCSRLFSARQFRANFRLSADLALQSRHLAQPTRSLEQQTPRSPWTSKAHRSRSRLAETAASSWRMLTAGAARPRGHVSLSGCCWTPFAAAMSAADGPLGALRGPCCHRLKAGRMQPGRASDEYMLSWNQYETRQRCKV